MSSLPVPFSFNFPSIRKPQLAQSDAQRALQEAPDSRALTAALVPTNAKASAPELLRDDATSCGTACVAAVSRMFGPQAVARWHRREGLQCSPGDAVLEVEGRAEQLLTTER